MSDSKRGSTILISTVTFLTPGRAMRSSVRAPLLLSLVLAIVVVLAGCDSAVSLETTQVEAGGAFTSAPGSVQLLASGLAGATGSTVGPGSALFVTEGAAGRISRIDPRTGEVTTFASGLPPSIIGICGVQDVAFLGGTAYALVTLVGPGVGGSDVVGIYRIDGTDSYTVVADIGAFNLANPPTIEFDYFVPTGVLYAMMPYRGSFLVSDGHLNRILHVTRDGDISVFAEFGNIVPTGLDVSGNTVYMAEAGPVPHDPADGKVVSLSPRSLAASEVASGAPLLVDVEFGRGRTLFALSQGLFDEEQPEGSPAEPNTGSLVRANADGTFTEVATELDRPISLEIIRNTAYVVTMAGEIWAIDNVGGPPFGASR